MKMHPILNIVFLCAALAITSVAEAEVNPPTCGSTWQLLYRHDAAGKSVAGNKASLLNAVRSGAPIRVAWGFRGEIDGKTVSVEHSAEPVFVSIVGGQELIVQLPEHIGQRSYIDPDTAEFDVPAVMWRGLMSTSGAFDAVWVNRATGEEVRRLPQRAGLAWFSLLPPPGCPHPRGLELAVPGGVLRR